MNTNTITYTILEPSTKADPFYLQNLMYDRPIQITDPLTITIIIPKNCSVFIIDDLHLSGATQNTIEFILEESSQLTYQFFVANHQLCERCEHKELYDCQKLPAVFEKNIYVNLTAPHAQAFLKCHYLGDQKSNFKLTTKQHHQASNTTSKLIMKSVLDEQAKLISDSVITVDKKIKNVTAEQTNKNLMLHPKARVISMPKLRVNSKDVSCKHGATVSTIDQEQLFYLQSRGIEKKEAERILIEAFLG
ncbi:SufD family Fe-S cluster assembly protein [Candidatus Dependentiae bacterium]|nr:SufD family Fe-S cluster assembly protein [Candidatus Dependentiae bacterium]